MCNLCPPVENPWTGRIDQEVLVAASEAIGLTLPVDVEINDRDCGDGANGAYSLTDSYRRGHHVIFMSSNVDMDHVDEVLLHELGHALQAEDLGFSKEGFDKMDAMYSSPIGHAIMELMADAIGCRYKDEFKIALAEEAALVA